MVDSIVQIFYILPIFLSGCSINYLFELGYSNLQLLLLNYLFLLSIMSVLLYIF